MIEKVPGSTGRTREDLISFYVSAISQLSESKHQEMSREYLLDLIRDVVAAVDGARKYPPATMSREALAKI